MHSIRSGFSPYLEQTVIPLAKQLPKNTRPLFSIPPCTYLHRQFSTHLVRSAAKEQIFAKKIQEIEKRKFCETGLCDLGTAYLFKKWGDYNRDHDDGPFSEFFTLYLYLSSAGFTIIGVLNLGRYLKSKAE